MAMLNVTGGVTNSILGPPQKRLRVQINQGWTGTVVLKYGATTSAQTTFATITNPATGQLYEYYHPGIGPMINAEDGGSQNPSLVSNYNIYVTTTNTSGTTDATITSSDRL